MEKEFIILLMVFISLHIKNNYFLGEVFNGMWNYGIKYGKGIYNWTSGENYDGEWKDDKMNGHGVFMFADKTVLEGEFINNEVKFYNYKLLKFLLGLI